MFVESDGALLIGLAACGVQYSGIAAGAVIGKAISVHRCLDKESFHRLAGRRRTARDYFRNWRRAMHMRMRFFVSYLRLLLPDDCCERSARPGLRAGGSIPPFSA